MISAFVPLAGAEGTRARRKSRSDVRMGLSVLAAAVLLEIAVYFFRDALLLHPLQSSVLFKQVSGYAMVVLMAFAMLYGALRRRAALAPRVRILNELHQFGGLLVLVLLGLHAGRAPGGFLLALMHATALGLAAGALRSMFGARLGRAASTFLLLLHIALGCLVSAAAVVHLYFVYAYTA